MGSESMTTGEERGWDFKEELVKLIPNDPGPDGCHQYNTGYRGCLLAWGWNQVEDRTRWKANAQGVGGKAWTFDWPMAGLVCKGIQEWAASMTKNAGGKWQEGAAKGGTERKPTKCIAENTQYAIPKSLKRCISEEKYLHWKNTSQTTHSKWKANNKDEVSLLMCMDMVSILYEADKAQRKIKSEHEGDILCQRIYEAFEAWGGSQAAYRIMRFWLSPTKGGNKIGRQQLDIGYPLIMEVPKYVNEVNNGAGWACTLDSGAHTKGQGGGSKWKMVTARGDQWIQPGTYGPGSSEKDMGIWREYIRTRWELLRHRDDYKRECLEYHKGTESYCRIRYDENVASLCEEVLERENTGDNEGDGTVKDIAQWCRQQAGNELWNVQEGKGLERFTQYLSRISNHNGQIREVLEGPVTAAIGAGIAGVIIAGLLATVAVYGLMRITNPRIGRGRGGRSRNLKYGAVSKEIKADGISKQERRWIPGEPRMGDHNTGGINSTEGGQCTSTNKEDTQVQTDGSKRISGIERPGDETREAHYGRRG
ncbi:hypothetical protein C922_05632 [Plasmodium inui San Antonio 1]|uniref:Uncharacterized protein n=1 Tax=Plasmodium inui San Antonio 1 TaxID=1237626 RepID=W7AFC1_9APIC|nr:hypothetical protein C922_05632 [Plasmodium inui San Antonio 1]EUD63986.1 hypothetical protein C922_05632 [Plasmodium inui San Antonio 1]